MQQSQPLKLNRDDLASALDDFEFRRQLARTFRGFCLIYLSHYLTAPPAEFHLEMMDALSDAGEKYLVVEGFRGSAKSVYGSLALPLYLALEHPTEYPFIIPIADTGLQSAINIANIEQELTNNKLILQDYGAIRRDRFSGPNPEPTLESDEEWQSKNMLLSNGVRILARSRGQKVRGLRHREHRPKIVIVDDPEDLEWVHTKENRDKTERWLTGEIIPGIDRQMGRLIVIGNMLSNDALIARLKRKKAFRSLSYPLVREDGTCTWPAIYPDQAALDRMRDVLGPVAWQREMLLKVIPEEGQPVKAEDLKYYDKLPDEAIAGGIRATGVDLAISKKETADYTAGVDGKLAFKEGVPRIYVLPNPKHERMGFKETIDWAKLNHMSGPGLHQLFVEDVQYQKAAIEEMQRAMLPVMAMKPIGDKRARLMLVVTYIKNGTILFPRTGCEDLIIELLGFGVEAHDDLVDAFVYMVLGLVQQGLEMPEVIDLSS